MARSLERTCRSLGELGMLVDYAARRSLEGDQVCRAISGDSIPWCLEVDEDGCVDFDGFVRLLDAAEANDRARRLSEVDGDVAEAFQHFDLDGDGFITAEDVLRVLTELGQELDLQAAEDIVAEADKDGDGCLDVLDFGRVLFQGRSVYDDECNSSMRPLACPAVTGRVTPCSWGHLRSRAAARTYRTPSQLTGARRRRFRARLRQCLSTKQFCLHRQRSDAPRLCPAISWRRRVN